ncbi:MAG TPA: hypothetical protein VHZ06_04965 [Marmoricola sp.]|jgi:hypothetical protein|nr:hypothetical protein [Marmoricola sp.]
MAVLTRTLATGATAVAIAGALAGPAQAHNPGGGHHGRGGHDDVPGLSLTRSAAATLQKYNVSIDVSKDGRMAHHGHDMSLRGTVVFSGSATTSWSQVRIDKRTHRISAVVNGGDREAVLRFRGTCDGSSYRSRHHGHGSVVRLTDDGAASIDHAAGADAFSAGDAFAEAGR